MPLSQRHSLPFELRQPGDRMKNVTKEKSVYE